MPLVLVVSPRPEHEVASLRRRLGAMAAVIGDADPDEAARAIADLLVLTGISWTDARGRLRSWRDAGLMHPVILALSDAPTEVDGALGPVTLAAQPFLEEAVGTAVLATQGVCRLRLAGAEVDLLSRVVLRDGARTALTALEARLLASLAAQPGKDFTREDLLVAVWGYQRGLQTRAVDMAISRLRRKIERDPTNPDHLQASRGGGYRFAPLTRPIARIARVSAPRTPFFGRTAELDRLDRHWRAGRRLVALLGPPGVGKSRLAREHALRRGGDALWCDASGAHDHGQLCNALAATLGLAIGALTEADLLSALGRGAAEHGDALLVIDQVEHVLPALRPLVEALLSQAPALRVLVTTRARPGLPGEVILDVTPLPLEDAASLFAERASAAGGDVGASATEALLNLLDRLPLAIELAAVRARAMPLPELRARLEHGQELIDPTPGALPLGALRDALAWSWSLLGPELREGLARLTVCGGAFDLALAEEVLGPDRARAAVRLAELVDRSVVQWDPATGRYRLLWSVRTYARAVAEASWLQDATRRHAEEMARRAARWREALGGAGARSAFYEVRDQQPELQVACAHLRETAPRWSAGQGPGAAALVDLAICLDTLFASTGSLDQRVALWAELWPALPDHGATLALALLRRARARYAKGAVDLADADLRDSAAQYAAAGDDEGQGDALRLRLAHLRRRGRFAEAEACLDALSRLGARSPRLAAMAEIERGFLACLRLGDQGEAGGWRRRMVRAAQRLDAMGEISAALTAWHLVISAHGYGDRFERALSLTEEFDRCEATRPPGENDFASAYQRVDLMLQLGRYGFLVDQTSALLAAARVRGRANEVALTASSLAFVYLGLGRHEEAWPLWAEAIPLGRRAGVNRIAMASAHDLCVALLEVGRHDEALERIEEGLHESQDVQPPRLRAVFELLHGLAALLTGQPAVASARLKRLNRADLRRDDRVPAALLSLGFARGAGEDAPDARAELADALRAPAFAGQQAITPMLAALDEGRPDELRAYTLPPVPPLFRLTARALAAPIEPSAERP